MHFRSLAHLQLDAKSAAAELSEPVVQRPEARQSWWGWLRGGSSDSNAEAPALPDDMAVGVLGHGVQLSDEQREYLASVISGSTEVILQPM
eukprot:scaffold288766_cov33-Tisochrysis_lutea.AAC.4